MIRNICDRFTRQNYDDIFDISIMCSCGSEDDYDNVAEAVREYCGTRGLVNEDYYGEADDE